MISYDADDDDDVVDDHDKGGEDNEMMIIIMLITLIMMKIGREGPYKVARGCGQGPGAEGCR